MIKTVRVSEKGQIAIPQNIREKLKITQGDDLLMIEIGERILIEKVKNVEKRIHDDFKDLIVFSEKSLKKIWDNKEDEIWNNYLKK